MSVIVLIGLGAIACILAHTMVNHSLSLAAVLIVASSSWGSPSSAADTPDASISTKVEMALLLEEDVNATTRGRAEMESMI